MPSPLFLILPMLAIVAIATVVLGFKTCTPEGPSSGNSYGHTSPQTDKDDSKKITSSPTKGKRSSSKKKGKESDDEDDDDNDSDDQSVSESFDGGSEDVKGKNTAGDIKKHQSSKRKSVRHRPPPSYDSCMDRHSYHRSSSNRSGTHHGCQHIIHPCNLNVCCNLRHRGSGRQDRNAFCSNCTQEQYHSHHRGLSCLSHSTSSIQSGHGSNGGSNHSSNHGCSNQGTNICSSCCTLDFGVVNESSTNGSSRCLNSHRGSESDGVSSILSSESEIGSTSMDSVGQWVTGNSTLNSGSDTDTSRSSVWSDHCANSNSDMVHHHSHHQVSYKRSECFICFEKEPNIQMVTLKPCKHNGICKNCIETHLSDSIKCPFCRKPIKSYSRNI